ncbi:MAG: PAS domain S-box protein [Nitrospirae bacterium]|nr:PAS domain S-box protein [Nitrospirota bacterium]
MAELSRKLAERKRAEEALRESEARSRSIIETAFDAVIATNRDGQIIGWNPQAEAIFGYSAHEAIGRGLSETIIPARFRQAHAAGIARVFQAGENPGLKGRREFSALHREGHEFPVELAITLFHVDGQPVLSAFVRNITERKRAEQALRESERDNRQLFELSPLGLALCRLDGRLIDINEAFTRILGRSMAETVGLTYWEVTPEKYAAEEQAQLESLRATGRYGPYEKEYIHRDGHLVPVRLSGVMIERGGEQFIWSTVEDITECKHMEEALRVASEERERISQDLHDGILQSLFAVGLCLEAANRLMAPRDRKAAGLSFDQAVGQLNQVIQEVRGFISGLGSDQLQGKDWLTELRLMLKSLTKNSPMRVRHSIEGQAVQALSGEQASHLLYIVQEAVSNGLRHSGAQEARVSLKMLKRGVRLSIRDNGRGFNPASVKGSGQGLINMAARAQKIGGRFTVFSSHKTGTHVLCDLPREAFHDSR